MKIKECIDYINSFFIQIGVIGVCICLHRLFIYKGGYIEAVEEVAGNLTSPTLGRFIYMFFSFGMFLILGYLAHRYSKENKNYIPFITGMFAGTFLWQFLGEDAWNFSIKGIHLISLESISALPLVILFIVALVYFYRTKALDWGIWCVIMSFSTNWFGHYVLECVYLPFERFISYQTFTYSFGCGFGVLLFLVGAVLGFRDKITVRQRMVAAVISFFALGIIAFAIMEA